MPLVSDENARQPVPFPRNGPVSIMRAFIDHTKCPESYVAGFACLPTSAEEGFFEFGGLPLYGRVNASSVSDKCNNDTLSFSFQSTELKNVNTMVGLCKEALP